MAQTRKRMVILTIDTMAELLKDYLGEGVVPRDAKALTLQINPQENGKLALVLDSPSIKPNAPDIFVHFDLKRIFAV